MRCTAFLIPLHCLVPAVIAGDIATAATHAFILIDMRINNVAAIEINLQQSLRERVIDILCLESSVKTALLSKFMKNDF